MKKPYYLSSGIILLLWFACSTFYAQKYNLKTEVLVYIMPDSLELPVHEKGEPGLQRATIKSSALATTLTKTKVAGIAKAFPAWTNKDSVVTRHDGEQIQAPPFHRIFTLTFNSETDADSVIAVLKQSGAVLFAEKHTEPTLDNDQFYVNGTQWYLNNDGRNGGVVGADINAEGAWAIYTGSSGNKIAIIDTGVELTHEDLSGKVTGENHFDDPHGTMVAGVAAAKANNTYGIRGVDWNAQIISKNISDAYGYYIGDAAMAQKIMDAVNEGANVLNRSGSSPDYSSTLAMAFAYAYKMNRVSVATMGNTGNQQVRYPAALPNVIAVGATQNNDVISGFSTTGNHIDVVAPGGTNPYPIYDERDIFTTTINIKNDYSLTSGTSFAAPQVTGLASLLKGYKPNLSNDDVRQIIRLSADKVPAMLGQNFTMEYGYGRINAGRALSYLTNPYALVQNTASSGTVMSTSSHYVAQFIGATGLATGNYLVKRIEVQKTVTLPDNVYNVTGAWGRGVFTSGWSAASPNFGEGFCEVVPGSLTGTSMTLRTYVYQVWSIAGSYLGYYPTSPSNATFAYSVLGLEKPTISGPSHIYNQGTYTITNLPVGATVQWSTLIPDYATITGQGTSTATFNFYRGLDGHDDAIKASIFVNGVVIKELTLSVFVGLGVSSIESLEYCGYNVLIAHATEDDNPNLTCTWTCNDGQFVYFPYGDDASFADKGSRVTAIQVAQSGYYTVCATLNDGTYTSPQFCSSVHINANGSYSAFSLYPNPATSLVTLSLLDTNMVAKNTSQQENALNSSSNMQIVNGLLNKYEIQLWNSMGLVKRVITDQPQYQMSLSGVSKGFYYVVVIR
ncbi:MAG: S8 family serine peptidase, partial [Paludibacter sp.]|nr:S8 family serine peptidase [Paludibacter sp.]